LPDQPKKPENPDGKKPVKRSTEYLKYSGMAVQMAVILFLGTYGGQKLDAHFQLETPWFTLAGALLGIVAAFYLTLKDFITGKE